MGGAQCAGERAWESVAELERQRFERALRQLKDKGLITSSLDSTQIAITKMGRERLSRLIPAYQEKRPWNGVFYVITYDSPTKHNKERNLLRIFLKKIGCGLLQESVWVTPYNHSYILKEFIEERGLQGTILVSSLGKGGAIGEYKFAELIEKVYKLSKLSERYREFIDGAKHQPRNKSYLVSLFLSILRDDPQLPFGILPKDWEGMRAYEVFQKLALHFDNARA